MTILSVETGLGILAGFSLLWVALGWWWGRKATSYENHSLAGRNVGLALATATVMATWVTSNTTMAAPQLALQLGVWGMVGYALGAAGLILFAPMAQRIRELMPTGHTSGDFVRGRFGEGAWVVFLLISLFYGIGWLVSMGMAGGVLLESLTGIPYRIGMLTIVAVCVAYTLLGGLHAVIGTDFIQTLLIMVGLVLVAVLLFASVGFDTVYAALCSERPGLLDALAPASVMFLFNNLLFGVGEIFHSNVWWSRALAIREGVGIRAFVYAGIAWIPVPIVAGSIALAAPALQINIPAFDWVGPMVVAHVLGPAGAVLILIVVVASLASSLDSLLAATSDLLVQDVYHRKLRPEAGDRELLRASRAICLGLGGLAVGVCWFRMTTLAEMIQFTGAFVGATIFPIIAGLYWPKANSRGALAGLILGTVMGLSAYFMIGFYVAALVGAAVSMVCVVLSTWLWPQSSFDWSSLRETR